MYGNEINVYINSIGQEITDYLVNFEFFIHIMGEYGFKPVHLKEYYLYKNDKDEYTLTLIGPDEWKSPYGEFVAKVRQLGDATWEKL